jgi:hypothetical protein
MKRLLKKNPLWKWLVVYVLLILFGGLLFSATWGGVNGLLVAAKLATDPSFQTEMMKIIGEESTGNDKDFLNEVSVEKRIAIEKLVRERFEKINWLPIHLIVNFITFSILGFLIGIILRDFIFSGILPLALLFLTLSILKANEFMVQNKILTIVIGLSVQLLVVYLFSFLGFRLRERMIRRKAIAHDSG